MDIKQQVKQMVKESQLFADMEQEPLEDEELHWDSMSLIWFISRLETTFSIELDYRTIDLEHFRTPRAIVLLVEHVCKGAPL